MGLSLVKRETYTVMSLIPAGEDMVDSNIYLQTYYLKYCFHVSSHSQSISLNNSSTVES